MVNETKESTPTIEHKTRDEIFKLFAASCRTITFSSGRLSDQQTSNRVFKLIAQKNRTIYTTDGYASFLFFDETENELARELYVELITETSAVLRNWVGA